MDHGLLNTIVMGLVGAFVCGLAAKKMKFPPILGYLIAGILVGPYTPGFIGDAAVAQQLAEVGIILLMFGVGLHFSFSDLMNVRNVALPGALVQMGTATIIGMLVAFLIGEGWLKGFIYGFSLSVASTVVLLRALEHRGIVKTETGKVAIGWLVVEDVAMVLALVLLPVLADFSAGTGDVSGQTFLNEIVKVALKIGGFIALMMVFGRKLLPAVFVAIARTKSSELMTLGTLAIALGFAYVAYAAFDASFALGAFLAGLVVSESEIGHKAAEKSLPLRDAFSVLFFVSVGMLFDPMTLLKYPLTVLVTLLIIMVGKSVAAYIIARAFRQTKEGSLTIAFSLAQIGEFSFILAGLALSKGLMTPHIYNLVLAGALLSIAINPFLFKWLDKKYAIDKKETAGETA